MNRLAAGRRLAIGFFGITLMAGVAACGGGSGVGSASVDGLDITGGWAKSSPMMVDAGAAYMTIESAEGDRLLSASVGSDIATEAQIHEVTMMDGGGMDEGGMDEGDTDTEAVPTEPMMAMHEVEFLELPAGEAVTLAPGGYHVMLLGLTDGLIEGETFEVNLHFEIAGDVTVEVEVLSEAP